MNGNREDRPKILIADDSLMNREILSEMLEDRFDILEAENGKEALSLLHQYGTEIDLLLLDVVMPEVGGFEVLQIMNQERMIEDIPVIIISAETDHTMVERAYELGVTDYIGRPLDALIVQRRVSNTIMLYAKQKKMIAMMTEANEKLWEENRKLQFHDPLTGKLNFGGFKAEASALMKRSPQKYALWYFDIKRFKYINNAFGYDTGDRLLRHWAEILSAELGEGELIGRISGDQIALLTRYSQRDELGERFWRYVEQFGTGELRQLSDTEVSAGIYLTDENTVTHNDVNQMIDRANIAQKAAKQLPGSRYAFFDEELWEKQKRAVEISQHMREGIANGEFEVWFQPQYNYVTGQMTGAEALVRWTHPVYGRISPGEFIPVLERSGQISELDHFVWETCCGLLSRWGREKKGLEQLRLSVNVSRMDIYSIGLCDEILLMTQRHGIPTDMLRLEITESAYMDEPKQLVAVVERFQEMGFTVEMDDFGSGFSSLNMLKELPIDVLKLDMRFLGEGGSAFRSEKILSSVVAMANEMELDVIAEGIETREQADYLSSVGCCLMQGYYFAKPMPLAGLEETVLQGCGWAVTLKL